jgi:hypothetical protein
MLGYFSQKERIKMRQVNKRIAFDHVASFFRVLKVNDQIYSGSKLEAMTSFLSKSDRFAINEIDFTFCKNSLPGMVQIF